MTVSFPMRLLRVIYSKTYLKRPLKMKDEGFQDRLLLNAGQKFEHSAILLTVINLPIILKTFVLSIFELPLIRV